MGWVVRLFDRRDTWARMVLLDLSGISYLVFGQDEGRHPTATQWWLAVAAFVVAIALCRWPAVCFLTQAALLGVAICVLDDTTINQVGASWALAEVALWARRPRTIWACAGLLFAVYVVFAVAGSPGSLSRELFGVIVLPVGLPLLLGLVIRTTRELGVQAGLRAESESRVARADERGAIARELHDVVAHHVASMVLRAGVARHVIPGLDPRVAEVLDDVHGTGTTALADLRRLVEVLRGPGGMRSDAAIAAIEPGALPAALGAAVDTARRTGLTVEADIDQAVGGVDAVRGLAVLRLTQEALTNVAKHAGPTARASLRVSVDDGAVSWEVADDGGPGQPNAEGGGHGLVGMRERVEVLGGRLTAGPDGSGWRVHTVLPRVAA
ncbi:sensor histidine kinase [Actinoplanes sp. NPDC051513]|uniref:sensor histidine kinase n=1 Tax=Actinoplanes sp. NPDC051513 TaxID=3363908 RepID=UPI0037AC0279